MSAISPEPPVGQPALTNPAAILLVEATLDNWLSIAASHKNGCHNRFSTEKCAACLCHCDPLGALVATLVAANVPAKSDKDTPAAFEALRCSIGDVPTASGDTPEGYVEAGGAVLRTSAWAFFWRSIRGANADHLKKVVASLEARIASADPSSVEELVFALLVAEFLRVGGASFIRWNASVEKNGAPDAHVLYRGVFVVASAIVNKHQDYWLPQFCDDPCGHVPTHTWTPTSPGFFRAGIAALLSPLGVF